jgi:REP element-mobilizing transposase RayT
MKGSPCIKLPLYDKIIQKMGDYMSRTARLLSKSGVYHIMLRGNEKKAVFCDDEDRIKYLDTMLKMKEDGNYHLYAYCLMKNHVHLLIREKDDAIQRTMKRICVSYVHYFNNKYQRIGHLYQDRFRSEVIEKESYLLAVARYIHNNPVKAGIVKAAENFAWSSCKDYFGERVHQRGLVDRGFLLSLLSDTESQAVELFREFTNQSNSDDFIDIDECSARAKNIFTNRKNLTEKINEILLDRGYHAGSVNSCEDKKIRNELIAEIKDATGASVRELSRIMGIGKDIIFRA